MAQKPVQSVGVILKDGLDGKIALDIVKKFVASGLRTYSLSDFADKGVVKVENVEELKGLRPDAVVSVGGDGTLLRTLRMLQDDTPVLSVNVGHRGILSEIRPEEIDEALVKLKSGNYSIDRRMRLSAKTSVELPPATNEIYLVRRRHIGTPYFTIKLSDTQLNVRMDGVIVSTPTGSTGHAYSLKGPVLQENLDGVLIVPASPLQNMPPVVIIPQPIIIKADHPTDLVIDGQEIYEVEAGEEVRITRYKYDANLIRLKGYTFKQLLRIIS